MCRQTPRLPVSRAERLMTSNIAKKEKTLTESIVSQNLRGLKSDARLLEVHFLSLRKCSIFSLCIQETWRHGCQILEHDQYCLILSDLDKKLMKSNRWEQDVGIALIPIAVAAWKESGFPVHDDFGGRTIAVGLMVKDKHNKRLVFSWYLNTHLSMTLIRMYGTSL